MTKRRTAIEHYDKLEKFLRFMDASDMDAAPLEPETKRYLKHIWSLVQGNKIHLTDVTYYARDLESGRLLAAALGRGEDVCASKEGGEC